MRNHLISNHKFLSLDTRKSILQQVESIAASVANAVKDVRFPTGIIGRIPELNVYHDASKCKWDMEGSGRCNYISRSPKKVKEHLKKAHGWQNIYKSGRPVKNTRRDIDVVATGIHCQQFFNSGGDRQALFEVRIASERIVPVARTNDDKQSDDEDAAGLQTLLRAADEADQKTERWLKAWEEEAGVAEVGRFELKFWLEVTRWDIHLKGINRMWLVSLLDPVDGKNDGSRYATLRIWSELRCRWCI